MWHESTTMTHGEIAAELAISPQAVKKRLKAAGIKPARVLVGRGGKVYDYDLPQLFADWRETLRLRPPQAGSAQGESLRDSISVAPLVTPTPGAPVPRLTLGTLSEGRSDGKAQAPTPGSSPTNQGGGVLDPSNGEPHLSERIQDPQAAALILSSPATPTLFDSQEIQRWLEGQTGRSLNAEDVAEALRKQEIIRPLSDQLDPRPDDHWSAWLGTFLPDGKRVVKNKTDAIEQRAWKYQVSSGAVWDWLRRFEAGGICALLRKERAGANDFPSLKSFGLDRLKVIAELQAQRYNARAAQRALKEAGTPVAYDVLKRIGRGVPQAVKDFYKLGPTALRDKHITFITRRWEDYEPNEMWESDHFNFDDLTQRWPNPNAIFPWATTVLDFATGYPLSWWPSFHPHSGTIVAAYARAFSKHGVPQSVGYDFGKDYRGQVVSGFMVRISEAFRVKFPQDVFQSRLPALRIHDFTKRKPQVKPCERTFGTIHKQFCSKFDSYRGPSTGKRSEWVDKMLAEHKKNPAASTLIHALELFRAFDYWFFHEYPYIESRGRKNKGRCPADLYRNSDRWLAPEELDLLRLTVETRIVRRSAVSLTLGGEERRFEHPDLWHHNEHEATIRHNFNSAECPDLDVITVECCRQRYEARWLAAPYCQEEVAEQLQIQAQQRNAPAWIARYLNHLQAGDMPADRLQRKALAAGTDHPALNPGPAVAAESREPQPASPFISDRLAMVKKAFSKQGSN